MILRQKGFGGLYIWSQYVSSLLFIHGRVANIVQPNLPFGEIDHQPLVFSPRTIDY